MQEKTEEGLDGDVSVVRPNLILNVLEKPPTETKLLPPWHFPLLTRGAQPVRQNRCWEMN